MEKRYFGLLACVMALLCWIPLGLKSDVIKGPSPKQREAIDEEYNKANRMLEAGQSAECAALLESIIKKWPSEYRTRRGLGLAYREVGRIQDTEKLFSEAYNEGDKASLFGLSLIKLDLRDFEWLEKNRIVLLNACRKQCDIVIVICGWSLVEGDPTLLKELLEQVDTPTIMSDRQVAESVLDALRFYSEGLEKTLPESSSD